MVNNKTKRLITATALGLAGYGLIGMGIYSLQKDYYIHIFIEKRKAEKDQYSGNTEDSEENNQGIVDLPPVVITSDSTDNEFYETCESIQKVLDENSAEGLDQLIRDYAASKGNEVTVNNAHELYFRLLEDEQVSECYNDKGFGDSFASHVMALYPKATNLGGGAEGLDYVIIRIDGSELEVSNGLNL